MDLHFYPMDVQNCTVEIESCKMLPILSVRTLKREHSYRKQQGQKFANGKI